MVHGHGLIASLRSHAAARTTGALLYTLLLLVLTLLSCEANKPGDAETKLAAEVKKMKIGGKDSQNPTPDTPQVVQTGKEHFQHHCQVCHGLDGHGTGVPFVAKMSPPVIDLGDPDVQQYKDGQLKWIIENGIRFSGMPAWKGVLEDEEMWSIVRFLRQLPAKGSQGIPEVFAESEEEHQKMTQPGQQHGSEPEHHH